MSKYFLNNFKRFDFCLPIIYQQIYEIFKKARKAFDIFFVNCFLLLKITGYVTLHKINQSTKNCKLLLFFTVTQLKYKYNTIHKFDYF